MPETPTPGVNGQVVSSPALHASMSISSLAPAAKMLGWAWSTATAGSFCLFWENGLVGLPTDTRVSPPWVAEATTGMTRAATKATNPATMTCRPNRMAPLLRGPAGPPMCPPHPKKTPPGRSQLRLRFPTEPAAVLSVIQDAAYPCGSLLEPPDSDLVLSACRLLCLVNDAVKVLPCAIWAYRKWWTRSNLRCSSRTTLAFRLPPGYGPDGRSRLGSWAAGRPLGSRSKCHGMDLASFALALSDGRALEVDVSGPDGAIPLVVHHGTPGERSQYPPFATAAAAQGLRYVSYSRPGYGGSSRQPGRAVADCAADTAAILAYLGADRCYTVGASGGGPHALACAALLANRVLACATVAGVGPFGAQDLHFLAGMGRENHEEFGATLAGPTALQTYLEQEAEAFAGVTGEQVAAALGDLVSAVAVAAHTGDVAA